MLKCWMSFIRLASRFPLLAVSAFRCLLLLAIIGFVDAKIVPKFEPTSVTATSLVIRMIHGENVARFDMSVHIYDLDRKTEFKRTELSGTNHGELLSFDGLTPATWFAFRIHYRILFSNVTGEEKNEFVTKQELVVRTRRHDEPADPSADIEDIIASVEEAFVSRYDIYIAVGNVFEDQKDQMIVVVPELRCATGVVQPTAKEVKPKVRFHFDLRQLGDDSRLTDCARVCIFPFLRVFIGNSTHETFRAREWCGSLEEVKRMGINAAPPKMYSTMAVSVLLFLHNRFL